MTNKMHRVKRNQPGMILNMRLKTVMHGDVPGGAVVKNPPANEGDMGSIPGPGRSHMSWTN